MRTLSFALLTLTLATPASAQTPGSSPPAAPAPAAPAPAAAAPPAEAPAPSATPAAAGPAPAPPAVPMTPAPTPSPASPEVQAPAPPPLEASAAPAADASLASEATVGLTGPSVDLDEGSAAAGDGAADDDSSADDDERALYGMRAQRLGHPGTSLGGYGELHYSLESVTGPGETAAEVDLHRLVLFVAHTFDERLRFYSEIEVEHAYVSTGGDGELAVEQAYVDYLLHEEALGLRAGIVLVPMGIINQWHEPPIFHGVERPQVDRVIIPSTWREAGVGVFGEPVDGFRYELYVVSGLDASGFSASSGLRGGRNKVSEARTDGLAVTGRVEVEPALGVVAGLSAYLGEAGPNADFYDESQQQVELDVPVYGVSLDARGRYAGLEARAVLAWFAVGDTAELRRVGDAEGNPLGLDVGSELYGLYGEVAYDVLQLVPDTQQQLLPFVRVERYDTLADVTGRGLIRADEAYGAVDVVAGLTYRPVPQVAFKTDFLWRSPDGPVPAQGRFDLGVGVMF